MGTGASGGAAGSAPVPPGGARPRTPWQKVRKEVSLRRGDLSRIVHFYVGGSGRRSFGTYDLPDGFQRVYCHHIRKTAGTSLFLSFLSLGGEDPYDVWRRIVADPLSRAVSGPYCFVSNDLKVLAEGAYLYGRSHHPSWTVRLPPDTFTVTALRDPLERFHSYFDYLVAGDDPGLPGRVAYRERELAFAGFDAFLDQVPAKDLLTQVWMFSERLDVQEAADRIAACSAVFSAGAYPEGLARMAGRLDLPLEPLRARVTTGGRSTLSDAQRARLEARLEPEYELMELLRADGVLAAPDAGPATRVTDATAADATAGGDATADATAGGDATASPT